MKELLRKLYNHFHPLAPRLSAKEKKYSKDWYDKQPWQMLEINGRLNGKPVSIQLQFMQEGRGWSIRTGESFDVFFSGKSAIKFKHHECVLEKK